MRNPTNRSLFDEDPEERPLSPKSLARKWAMAILAIRPTVKIPEGVIEALADDLIRWCPERYAHGVRYSPEEQMQWLAQEVRDRFDMPPTPKDLKSMILEKFNPVTAGNAFKALDVKPRIECQLCNDWGARLVSLNGRQGYVWCTCPASQRQRQDVPDYVELLNSFQIRQGGLKVRAPSLRFKGNRPVCIDKAHTKRPGRGEG